MPSLRKHVRRTNVGGFFETGICDETNSSMVPLRVPKTVHYHKDILTTKLSLDALESPLQTEPEVDLLRGRPRRHVPTQLRHRLDRLDPLVHMGMQSVQEGAVV